MRDRIGAASTERVYVELDSTARKLKLIFTQLRDVDTDAYVCSAKRNAQSVEDSVSVTVTRKFHYSPLPASFGTISKYQPYLPISIK